VHSIDWSEQVQVKRLVPDEIVWDGIRLDALMELYRVILTKSSLAALPPAARSLLLRN
jgi:hypothetical protein